MRIINLLLIVFMLASSTYNAFAFENKENSIKEEKFNWWPTDASPDPVKDEERQGYWWWPNSPGKARPWGNRGYVYLHKVIFDYKAEERKIEEKPILKQEIKIQRKPEPKPSLLIKRVIKNVKIYFGYNKSEIRDDAVSILKNAAASLRRNKDASILITGNCDRRGSDKYNDRLGKERGLAVKSFMIENGIDDARIKIISRGKLDAVAPVNDLAGMQKDRNVQFMIAEVEEIMLMKEDIEQNYDAELIDNDKFLLEKNENIESGINVSVKEYIVKKGDSLSKIAQKELGSWHRWKYLYELNKDRIKNSKKIKIGQKIRIPVE